MGIAGNFTEFYLLDTLKSIALNLPRALQVLPATSNSALKKPTVSSASRFLRPQGASTGQRVGNDLEGSPVVRFPFRPFGVGQLQFGDPQGFLGISPGAQL